MLRRRVHSIPDEDGYSVADLEKWIRKAQDNIARLQEGIDRERAAMTWAQSIIDDLKAQEDASGSPT